MIPAHLSDLAIPGLPADWYARHQAWLASVGDTPRHTPPPGTVPVRAHLSRADLSRADLADADLTGAYLTGADLTGARIGDYVVPPIEARLAAESATLAACVAAIAAEPDRWDQTLWHDEGYDPLTAQPGSCGSAHCLAGWSQALLPAGHALRSAPAQVCGAILLPAAHAAGWFAATVHPDLAALVATAIAERQARQ